MGSGYNGGMDEVMKRIAMADKAHLRSGETFMLHVMAAMVLLIQKRQAEGKSIGWEMWDDVYEDIVSGRLSGPTLTLIRKPSDFAND